MKSESETQQLIQLEAPKFGSILMRNNNVAFTDKTGRLVRAGLGNVSSNQNYKSSDLIGWTEVLVTPDMVGKTVAVFTAIEVKSETWKPKRDSRETAQNNFITWVNMRGGIAAIVKSVDEFVKVLTK